MFTRKRFSPPIQTGDAKADIAALAKAMSDYLLSLETKEALNIDAAAGVNSTPVGDKAANTGAFTTLAASSSLSNEHGAVTSGTYTPTLTAVTNVSATTSNPLTYLRVGDMVTVSGLIAVDPTAASSTTTLRISLPISSTFSAATDGAGVAACATIFGMSGTISASVGNNAMGMNFVSDSGAANQTWAVHFTYQVK